VPDLRSVDASRGRRDVKISVRGSDRLSFGDFDVDLSALNQLVDPSQTRAVGHAIYLAKQRFMGENYSLARLLDALEDLFDREGLDVLDPWRRGEAHPGDFARPRRLEIAAALNRLRSLELRHSAPAPPPPSPK
jgi:hypothetical protein